MFSHDGDRADEMWCFFEILIQVVDSPLSKLWPFMNGSYAFEGKDGLCRIVLSIDFTSKYPGNTE